MIRPSQHGFMKGRLCLTNLISFYDKVTCLVDEGTAVDVVYLDFGKAFDTVSHSILVEKLAAHGLEGCAVRWVKTGWMARPQVWWRMELNPVGGWSQVVLPRAQCWRQICLKLLLCCATLSSGQ